MFDPEDGGSTSINVYETLRRHIAEDSTPRSNKSSGFGKGK
jgi:hypothetical protein